MTTTTTRGAADLPAMVSKALREAYNLGQRYWQQADSEYISQHKKADDTRAKFLALVEETCAALAAGQATEAQPAAQQPHRSGCTAGTDEECVRRGCGTNCPAVSPRQGVAYAALPEPDLFADCDSEGGFLGDTSDVRVLNTALFRERSMRDFADATCALRASHGQAPAQPTQTQAGAVPLTDEQIKTLMQAHRTAMLMTCKAKVPECGEFAAIAQDLDWLCESFGIKGDPHGTDT